MDTWLKHGIASDPKTRLLGRRITIFIVLFTWALSILACTRSVIQPWQVTATAIAGEPLPQVITSPTHPGGITPVSIDPPSGTITPSPLPSQTPLSPTRTVISKQELTEKPPTMYYTQAGDTLPMVAVRFDVSVDEIITSEKLPPLGSLLSPNLLLLIPNGIPETGPSDAILPDSEVVYSPSAVDFDIDGFVNEAGGYLSTYREWLSTGWNTGADVVRRISIENSVNPRLILALIEYQGHWVYGQPQSLAETDYPLGYNEFNHKGLYKQLSWAVQQISIGYYGWRAGLITGISFENESKNKNMRLAPQLNAGSIALQFLFSKLYDNQRTWSGALYSDDSLVTVHEQMFGNPWLRAQTVEPLYPPNLQQPALELPFVPGKTWSFTGGPHSAWGPDGALAAVDFAPSSMSSGCVESLEWATAAAPGQIVRAGNGVVIIDLDGDGFEQTGWALLYMHISSKDRVQVGTYVNTDDRLGHPSCEGGVSTGTHFHFARKYNGEWILADGPTPMDLGGWQVHAGEEPYLGTLIRDGNTVTACQCGSFETHIARPTDPSP